MKNRNNSMNRIDCIELEEQINLDSDLKSKVYNSLSTIMADTFDKYPNISEKDQEKLPTLLMNGLQFISFHR